LGGDVEAERAAAGAGAVTDAEAEGVGSTSGRAASSFSSLAFSSSRSAASSSSRASRMDLVSRVWAEVDGDVEVTDWVGAVEEGAKGVGFGAEEAAARGVEGMLRGSAKRPRVSRVPIVN
jgi:hypothetical protein